MKLIEYNKLAYEFAIRNDRVIELLSMPLTEKTASELLSFGIDTLIEKNDESGSYTYYGYENLYLNYDHLKHLNLKSFRPFIMEDNYDWKKYFKTLHRTHRGIFRESIEDAIPRINALIETRGSKLTRLMSGDVFKHYDEVVFAKKSKYSIDPTRNTSKTINSDIEFIKEWINPEKYLQLLPGEKVKTRK